MKTHAPVDGRRSFSGLLVGVRDGSVVLDCDGDEVVLPHDAIAKANLKPDIDFGDE